ncbi:MAG: sigma-54 interaction domain-containing protein [Geminicoccaceae bacterium]
MKVLIIGLKSANIADAAWRKAVDGVEIINVDSIDGALKRLRSERSVDLIMINAEADIKGLIKRLNVERVSTPVVAYGVNTDARTAVRAIRAGAREFLPLPPDQDLISAIFDAVINDRKEFVFEDPAMRDLLAVAHRVAPADASVLITGESGTGKEMVARYIHEHSRRRDRCLVSVNCAAIPDNLLESELFGHEKGAFTGANSRRIGKFEEANGGTLLLDEISEMDPRLQAKLLRAIQEREIDRVGGTRTIKVDIRVVATSNRDLPSAVAEGQFREDLLFRLNVVELKIPALRERPGDIVPLSRLFIGRYAQANGLPVRTLSDEALARLQQHRWPGNVRELENCIHRAVLLSQGDSLEAEAIIFPGDQPERPAASTESDESLSLVGQSMADVERRLILDTLEHTLGNRTHAATILGISIRTLRNKLRQYGDEGLVIPPSGVGGAGLVASRS